MEVIRDYRFFGWPHHLLQLLCRGGRFYAAWRSELGTGYRALAFSWLTLLNFFGYSDLPSAEVSLRESLLS